MTNVGYATLPVIPSVRGIGSSIATQITAPLVSQGGAAGKSAGNAIKNGILGVARTIAGPLIAYAGFNAIKNGIASTIDAASDLNEAGTAVTAVFGSAFPAIERWSQGSARALGQSQLEALQAAQTFGVYGKAAGLAEAANAEFSTSLAGLATDLASFYNTSPQEAAQAIAAGLRGESEPLRAYGVLLDDATLRAKAMELGLISTTKNALTPQQRVLAANAAILEQTTVAQGDFTKTSAGLANQQRITAALWTDISARMGTLFLPAAVAVQTGINNRVLPALTNTVDWLSNRLPSALSGLSALLIQGDFTGQLREAFNVAEDSPIIDVVLRIRETILNTWTAVQPALAAIGSAFITLGPPALELWNAISPVSNIFRILGPQLPEIASLVATVTVSVTNLVSAGLQALLPVLTEIVGWLVQAATWLAQNQGVVVALAAAWLAWRAVSVTIGVVRAAQAAYTAATYGAAGATYANAAANQAQAIAARVSAAAVAFQNSAVYRSVAAWIANTAAVATNNSLSLATKAAIIASSVATGIATAAQWAWNAALSANPIGIIIIAIAALVAAIIWVATQTTFFQDLWTNVTTVIGTAATWLWENVLQPVFQAIGAIFTWIYENIILPVVTGIMIYIGLWAAVITWLWENVAQPVFAALGQVFTWIYENVIRPIIDGIVLYFQIWGAIFTWLYQNVVVPVFNAIAAVFQWIYQNVIVPVVNNVQAQIRVWGAIFSWLWNNAINPAIQAVGNAMNWVWRNVIQPVANFIGDAVRNIGNVFQSVFSGIAGFVGNAFAGIAGAIRGPINGVIGLANSAIRAVNGISVTIPDWVPIVGGQRFGLSIPQIPYLARGANIMPRTGGTMAILGEAGRAETVTDLGLTNALIQQAVRLATQVRSPQGRGDQNLTIEGNVGYDPEEIFDEWDRKKKQADMLEGMSSEVVP